MSVQWPAAAGGMRPFNEGLAERLVCRHDALRAEFPGLDRIAVAIYDQRTDLLKAFVHSDEGANPFEHAMSRLGDLKGLADLARTGGSRIINDLTRHKPSSAAHLKRLLRAGYRASYTLPIFDKGSFQGFVFLNSTQLGYFTPPVARALRPVAEVVAITTMMELDTVRMIQGAVRTIRQISRARDEETSSHLDRMARYARLIALRLAPRRGMSDEWVEFLCQFAPLHDVGKIAVPDHILLKPGRLTPEEYEVMKGHVAKGVEIVDAVAETFHVGNAPYLPILRNVVAQHHEAVDGSGYPAGLAGDQVSLEGRIVAVADVFDALTSIRPYKRPWSVHEALSFLAEQAGRKFDAEAVEILRNSGAAVADIRRQFSEDGD